MVPNPTSLPPIWSVTRSVFRETASSWGRLLPWACHICTVVAPEQLTSVNVVALSRRATSDG